MMNVATATMMPVKFMFKKVLYKDSNIYTISKSLCCYCHTKSFLAWTPKFGADYGGGDGYVERLGAAAVCWEWWDVECLSDKGLNLGAETSAFVAHNYHATRLQWV